jgi:hypothetical protein
LHFEWAKRNLIVMDVIGFQDYLERFAVDIKKSFAYDNFNVPIINTRKSRKSETALLNDNERLLAEINSYDMQIWYWARSRFSVDHVK